MSQTPHSGVRTEAPAADPSSRANGASSEEAPRLAAPGAGVPAIERVVGGLRLAVATRRGPRAVSAVIANERDAIGRMVAALTPAQCATRVLIPRLRGLEDSSRWWSVWMTLDHLRIVNTQIAEVIANLGRGRVPSGTASTAAMKPSPDATATVLVEFERSCDAIEGSVSACPNLRTAVRFAHPWFGPLDAAGWHALAGMHMGIHRAQIDRIVSELAAPANADMQSLESR
jgi:hypothetical protein